MDKSAERSADSKSTSPAAWAVINEGDGEMIDVVLIEPDPQPGLRYEPLYFASPA